MKRTKPRQHIRRTKTGKKIIVNKGVSKKKRFFDKKIFDEELVDAGKDGIITSSEMKSLMKRKSKTGNHYKIRLVGDEVLHDYAGMNHYAAKKFSFTPVPKKKEIFIDKNLKPLIRDKTIIHEIKEANIMSKGTGYWPAHLKSLEEERKVRK